jgi:exodeoxyribonuclease-5
MYGYHFADVELRSLDYDWEIDALIWLDTLSSDSPESNNMMHRDLFWKIAEDYPELQRNKKQLSEAVYASPYYNARQARMAYAITGHKTQGGQWARVFIDPYIGGERRKSTLQTHEVCQPPRLGDEARDFYRWLYTAITRATNKVYFIKNK